MSIFKIQQHAYEDDLMLLHRLNYIKEPEATLPSLCLYRYISPLYPFEEMMIAKNMYIEATRNTLSGKHFYEWIISVKEEESLYVNEFRNCIDDIVKYLSNLFGGSYQTIACIHTNTDNLHAHIIENNIDFRNGNRLNIAIHDFFIIRNDIDRLLQNHRFSNLIPVSSM